MKSLRNHLIRKPATYNLDKVFGSFISMGVIVYKQRAL